MTTDHTEAPTAGAGQAPANQPGASALAALRTVEFRLGLKGYNVDEVDEYLEQVASEADALRTRCQALEQDHSRLSAQLADLEAAAAAQPAGAAETGEHDPGSVSGTGPETDQAASAARTLTAGAIPTEALQETLLLAQQFVAETRRRSEQEAAELAARAREEADRLVSAARAEADLLESDLAQRRQAELGALEADRDRLVAARDQLAGQLENDRRVLRERLTRAAVAIEELRLTSPESGPAAEPAAEVTSAGGAASDPSQGSAGSAAPSSSDASSSDASSPEVVSTTGPTAEGAGFVWQTRS